MILVWGLFSVLFAKAEASALETECPRPGLELILGAVVGRLGTLCLAVTKWKWPLRRDLMGHTAFLS